MTTNYYDLKTLESTSLAMDVDSLREEIRTLTHDIERIERQLQRSPDYGDWRSKAKGALAVRQEAREIMQKVLTTKEEDSMFMTTARKLLDPSAFNTIMSATRRALKVQAGIDSGDG